MKAILYVYVLSGLLSASCLVAQPRVVKTTPANAAGDIEAGPITVEVVFSEAMQTNSWSVVKAGRGQSPEVVGDPWFADTRTWRVRVKLAPGTLYGLGLNSATRRGFVAANNGRPLEPFVLTFTTKARGEAKSDTTPPSNGRPGGAAETKARGKGPTTVVFQRVTEPREQAFDLLMPKGWLVEGGITRFSPDAFGAKNAIDAKVDFTLKRDAQGSVLMRWWPDLYYAEVQNPLIQGMFPPGSKYNETIAMPRGTPAEFLLRLVLPRAHPGARNVRVAADQDAPKLAAQYEQFLRTALPMLQQTLSYRARALTVNYEEDGVAYTERLVTCLEDFGPLGAGLWRNRDTFLCRAPGAEFDAWLPVLGVVQSSVRVNSTWLAGEVRGALIRQGILDRTEEELRRLDREITAHRRAINEQIQHDQFLTLMGQEEYINPFTKEVEVGSNQWNHRWQAPNGDLIYTNDPNYDPGKDPVLGRSDFKRSPIKPKQL